MSDGMIIIGAGECGGRAALALRENGYGGPVTLIGEEVHLPYERPPLSKEAMTASETPLAKAIATADHLMERGITFVGSSPAASIERVEKTVRLASGRVLTYDKLLLTTGAIPRRLPLVGPGLRVAYLRTFDDALAIRKHLVGGCKVAVVGGGFIGLELAASARKHGSDVIVVEAQPRILMRGVPADIAAVIHALHVDRGVEMTCGDGIASIEEHADVVRIRLASGRLIQADIAVIGIGAVPMTALAEGAGLKIENGIAVDERLRTSDPDIFAAGDCCSFPLAIYSGRRVRLEAWRNAQEQGALAARNMLGAGESHVAVPWFWSDQYEFSLHIAGLSDEGRTVVRRDLGNGAFILFHLADDGRLVAASGIGPGNAVAKDIRLAEMLIAKRARPDPLSLASIDVRLRNLLAA
jgi:3-phenylpropionate/trans-cinnamate dioxygenase ferredoxin reductase component